MKAELVCNHANYSIYRVEFVLGHPDNYGYMIIEKGEEVKRNNNLLGGIYAPNVKTCIEYIDSITCITI